MLASVTAPVHGCIYGCTWKDLDALAFWHVGTCAGIGTGRIRECVMFPQSADGKKPHRNAPIIVLRVDRSPASRLGQQPLQPTGFRAPKGLGSQDGAPRRPRDRREWRRCAARRPRSALQRRPQGMPTRPRQTRAAAGPPHGPLSAVQPPLAAPAAAASCRSTCKQRTAWHRRCRCVASLGTSRWQLALWLSAALGVTGGSVRAACTEHS